MHFTYIYVLYREKKIEELKERESGSRERRGTKNVFSSSSSHRDLALSAVYLTGKHSDLHRFLLPPIFGFIFIKCYYFLFL
jgi:hypothetical protein